MIYFISLEDKYVKIGYSNKPKERIKDLQCGSAFEYKVEVIVYGDRKDESKLHSRFRNYLFRNEWFYLEDELREYIKECSENNALVPELKNIPIKFERRVSLEFYIEKCVNEFLQDKNETLVTETELVKKYKYQIAGNMDIFCRNYYNTYYPDEYKKRYNAENGNIVTIYYDGLDQPNNEKEGSIAYSFMMKQFGWDSPEMANEYIRHERRFENSPSKILRLL